MARQGVCLLRFVADTVSDLLSYTDETGSHSRGRYFVVAGVAFDGYHNEIREGLRRAEANSKKGKADWHDTHPRVRVAYLEQCLGQDRLAGRVFFRIHRNISRYSYLERTAETLVAGADHFGRDGRAVRAAHEGFTVGSRRRLQTLLNCHGEFQVRAGSFNDRPEIRLADALCGLLGAVHCSEGGARYEHLVMDWFVEV